MILLSHPTANQNVRQTALALAEAGVLGEFWTCVNWNEEGFLQSWLPLPKRARRELERRSFGRQLQPFIRTFPWREWGRLISGQLGLSWATGKQASLLSMDAVYYSLDHRIGRHLRSKAGIHAIYGYDNGSLESFRAAKNLDIKRIYEHPVVYWRKVREFHREEAELHPEWGPTLGALRDSEEKLQRKEEELRLADVIVVASTFSKNSLEKNAPALKAEVRIIPYGAPPIRRAVEAQNSGNKLRVLFVGGLSQAKGLGYLLEAAARLNGHIELTLVGHRVSATIPEQRVLNRYRWMPSLPHDQLLVEMAAHDVLVLPSLHEGFGLVILEAMAQRMVVITTPHTAGPDVITDGVDGFIVPIRSSDAIQERLVQLLSDRQLLRDMRIAAGRRAEMRPWESYRRELGLMATALIQ